MDLDDLDSPSGAPTRRTSRFAPKSSKPKLIPKTEPSSQPEPSKLVDTHLTNKKEEVFEPPVVKKDEESVVSSARNGVVDMEIEVKAEVKANAEVEAKAEAVESKAEDAMEEDDRNEDSVVREIDVFFTPTPSDDKTKVCVFNFIFPFSSVWLLR